MQYNLIKGLDDVTCIATHNVFCCRLINNAFMEVVHRVWIIKCIKLYCLM